MQNLCIVRIQPGKQVLGHEDYTAPPWQHERDDQTWDISALKSLHHEVGPKIMIFELESLTK